MPRFINHTGAEREQLLLLPTLKVIGPSKPQVDGLSTRKRRGHPPARCTVHSLNHQNIAPGPPTPNPLSLSQPARSTDLTLHSHEIGSRLDRIVNRLSAEVRPKRALWGQGTGLIRYGGAAPVLLGPSSPCADVRRTFPPPHS